MVAVGSLLCLSLKENAGIMHSLLWRCVAGYSRDVLQSDDSSHPRDRHSIFQSSEYLRARAI